MAAVAFPSATLRNITNTSNVSHSGQLPMGTTTNYSYNPTTVTTTSYPTTTEYSTTTIQPRVITSSGPMTIPHHGQSISISPHGTSMVTTTTTMSGTLSSAFSTGKLYQPVGTVYIPPGHALKAGMYTSYDPSTVPTFEAPLVFSTGTTQHQVMERHVTSSSIAHSKPLPKPIAGRTGCC